MDQIKFSIIVVCLNPGDKLEETLKSVFMQAYSNYEVIIKDGMSKDGSLDGLRQDGRIRLVKKADTGIYDAMNQALEEVSGDYVLFLNCGDTFYNGTVLAEAAKLMRGRMSEPEGVSCKIYYGDTFCEQTGDRVMAPPVINGFACYRNIPCHQSCFYRADLFRAKPYDLQYRIRADYDHFLWCYYQGEADPCYMDLVVAAYEGGGFSESRANRKRDKEEHRVITKTYMAAGELWKYKTIMALTLAPLRSWIAEKSFLSGVYQRVKMFLYRKKR